MCSVGLDKYYGQTLDGKNPVCRCYCEPEPGSFVVRYPRDRPPKIPCIPPCPPPKERPGCFWAPRAKNYVNKVYPCKYCPPKCCTRPCCLHIRPKECCCRYDDPCTAACLDHRVGVKPSGRYPPQIWCGPLPRNPCSKC